jgi:RimJ/RimL family protein N-acetyltransferase
LLEGETVNLKVMEKEDLPLLAEWLNEPEMSGIYWFPIQRSKAELEKSFEPSPFEYKEFIIEKKDGTKIGRIVHFNTVTMMGRIQEIGFELISSERGKGYATEAAKMMVDYLFLTKGVPCIQATTDAENATSQRVLEKAGFKKEGLMRKRFFANGEWRDFLLFSILREEWKEPKILTRTDEK